MATPPLLTIEEVDAKLDGWADDHERFSGRIKRWARRLNREGRSLELSAPGDWRDARPEIPGVATIEDQLRAEIDSIKIGRAHV